MTTEYAIDVYENTHKRRRPFKAEVTLQHSRLSLPESEAVFYAKDYASALIAAQKWVERQKRYALGNVWKRVGP